MGYMNRITYELHVQEEVEALERRNRELVRQQQIMRSLLEDLQAVKERLEVQQHSLREQVKALQEQLSTNPRRGA